MAKAKKTAPKSSPKKPAKPATKKVVKKVASKKVAPKTAKRPPPKPARSPARKPVAKPAVKAAAKIARNTHPAGAVDVNLLSDLLKWAKANGADAADALYVNGESISVAQRLGKREKLESSEGRDLGLRVFVGKRQAFVSSTDFDPASLRELASRAVDMARAVPEDPFAASRRKNCWLARGPTSISTTGHVRPRRSCSPWPPRPRTLRAP